MSTCAFKGVHSRCRRPLREYRTSGSWALQTNSGCKEQSSTQAPCRRIPANIEPDCYLKTQNGTQASLDTSSNCPLTKGIESTQREISNK